MSGIRGRLLRLEQVKAEAFSLKGLAERMRRRRGQLIAPSHPRTREELAHAAALATPGSVAHTMLSRALKRFDEHPAGD